MLRASQYFGFVLAISCCSTPILAIIHQLKGDKGHLVLRYLPETTAENFESHINAYSLPFGILGMVSHLLTHWVFLCHVFGRTPLWPWKYLQHQRWDLCIVIIASTVSTTIACVTLVRTRGSTALMTLAGMQIVLGVLLDAVNIHQAILNSEGWHGWVSFWVIPLDIVSFFSFHSYSKFECKPHLENSYFSNTKRAKSRLMEGCSESGIQLWYTLY